LNGVKGDNVGRKFAIEQRRLLAVLYGHAARPLYLGRRLQGSAAGSVSAAERERRRSRDAAPVEGNISRETFAAPVAPVFITRILEQAESALHYETIHAGMR
jgi:hypothetical protein